MCLFNSKVCLTVQVALERTAPGDVSRPKRQSTSELFSDSVQLSLGKGSLTLFLPKMMS